MSGMTLSQQAIPCHTLVRQNHVAASPAVANKVSLLISGIGVLSKVLVRSSSFDATFYESEWLHMTLAKIYGYLFAAHDCSLGLGSA